MSSTPPSTAESVLSHLTESGTGIISRASRLFLGPINVNADELVANTAGLLSGLNSNPRLLPKAHPRPLAAVVEHALNLILRAGGKIQVRNPSEDTFHEANQAEIEDFCKNIESRRFTVVESKEDKTILQLDITQ